MKLRAGLLSAWLIALLATATTWPAAARAEGEHRVSVGSAVRVGPGEELNGDVVVVGADATILGRVRGSVVAVGGDVVLEPSSTVDGDAVAVLGRLERKEGSRVLGSEMRVGSDGAAGRLAADVDGAVRGSPSDASDRNHYDFLGSAGNGPASAGLAVTAGAGGGRLRGAALRLGTWLLGTGLLAVLGLLLLATWPERSRNLRRTVEAAPGVSLVMGFLVAAAFGLLFVLLLISVVGWLALPLLAAAAAVLALLGWTGLCEAVGDRIPFPGRLRSRATDFLLGCGLLAILAIPWAWGGFPAVLAWLVAAVLGCLGMGAALLSGLGRGAFGNS
jgi:hypothetical protein